MKIAMICSCGKRSMDMPPILDVEKVLQDFAWKDFKEKTGTVEKLFLRRREYEVEVPMNYFHFEDAENVIKPINTSPRSGSRMRHMHSGTSVLSTNFRNNTNISQTYRFRIERTRKATLSVTFQRGFCIGGKAQFKLRLPSVFGESNEVDMRLHISKTTGETFDETLTFEANSDINVEENCDYTANVAFTEKEISAEFMIQTVMRMPNGLAPVFIRRKRDRELQATVFVNDLNEVFSEYTSVAVPVEETSKDGKLVTHAIKFITTGIVEGMRLSGQTIYLDSTKIHKRNASDGQTMSTAAGRVTPSGLPSDAIPNSKDQPPTDESGSSSDVTKQPETRILKAPQIPTIITTAPSSQETSPPSDAETSVSLESQYIPDDEAVASPCPTRSPAPSSQRASPGDNSKQSSRDKDVSSHPLSRQSSGNVTPSCRSMSRQNSESKPRPSSRQSSRDIDTTHRPPSRQTSKDVEPSSRLPSRQSSRDIEATGRPLSRQSSRDIDTTHRPPSRQTSKDVEPSSRLPSRQSSRDIEATSRPLSRQSSRDIEATSRPSSRQSSRDIEAISRPLSRQSSKDIEATSRPPSRQSSRDIETTSRPPSRQSSRDLDTTSRPPSRQSSRDIEATSRPPSRQSSRDIETTSRPPSRQSSRDTETTSRPPSRQTSREFESISRGTSRELESISKPPSRQTSRDNEPNLRPLTRQASKDSQPKSRPPIRQTSKDTDSNTLPITKQTARLKEKPTLKQTKSLSRGSKDESTVSFHEVKFHPHSQKANISKPDSSSKRDSFIDTPETSRTKPEGLSMTEKPEPTAGHLTNQTSSADAGQEMPTEADRPYIRRCMKHETLERLERVSSLSDERRVVYRSGSLPRSSPQPCSPPRSIEAQSSEEDSTTSLSKLAKCTSV